MYPKRSHSVTGPQGWTILLVAAVLAWGVASPLFAENRLGFYVGPNIASMNTPPDDEFGTTSSRTGLSIGTFYDGSLNRNVAVQFRGGRIAFVRGTNRVAGGDDDHGQQDR